MNKFIAMGRLTRDPEVSYGYESKKAVANYGIAVDRKYKRDGQPTADFFNCVSFGKTAEFVEKYLRKGTKIVIEGELQNNDYTNREGQKVKDIRVLVNQVEFAESKSQDTQPTGGNDFMSIPDGLDDELPFE